MRIQELLQEKGPILGEASTYERLRRSETTDLDPFVAHASLAHDAAGAQILGGLQREYLDVGLAHGLPMLVQTATWRASIGRCLQSRLDCRQLNIDNVALMRSTVDPYAARGMRLCLSGVIGPKGDAYRPDEALSESAADDYHAPQAEALLAGGVDVLCAATLPALSEAMGLAGRFSKTHSPYILSFVVRAAGTLLDGTPLVEAIERIDNAVAHAPQAYCINCVHPTVLLACLTSHLQQGLAVRALDRVVGFYANTSARSPEELNDCDDLITAEPQALADGIAQVRAVSRIRIFGGCCGTNTAHLRAIAGVLSQS